MTTVWQCDNSAYHDDGWTDITAATYIALQSKWHVVKMTISTEHYHPDTRFFLRKWCLLTSVFISCCPLLSQAGTPSELKDIHISSPDVNMNYIKSPLFLDVCIEIVTVKQSAFSLFAFMCLYLYVCSCLYFTMCVFFLIFSGVWFIVMFSLLQVRLLRASIKINQSINQITCIMEQLQVHSKKVITQCSMSNTKTWSTG